MPVLVCPECPEIRERLAELQRHVVMHYRPRTKPRARLYEFVSDNLKYARDNKVEALRNAVEEIDRQEFAEKMPEDWFWTLGYLSGKACGLTARVMCGRRG